MANTSKIFGTNGIHEKQDGNATEVPSNGNSVEIGEIIEAPDVTLMSTSAVLYYCKSKILYPYLKCLALVGLRPASLDQIQSSKICSILSHFHTLQIALLVCTGYVLQYMSCFRRDRGFIFSNATSTNSSDYNDTLANRCEDTLTFGYIVPSGLHFCSYVHAIYLFRMADNEYLQNLMEKVFLLSSFPPQNGPYASPKRLLKTLWMYIIFGVIWTLLSLAVVISTVLQREIAFQWIDEDQTQIVTTLKVLLIVCTFTHDAVQATVLIHYCIQAQLLTAQLDFLHERLLMRTISPLDWMKELSEFKKLLGHLNGALALGACPLVLVDACWAFSSAAASWTSSSSLALSPIRLPNAALWAIACSAPFASAARLNGACAGARDVGHEIVARPFPHRDAPQRELDAVLLYAPSLRLAAKLFEVPIRGRHLCATLALLVLVATVVGMRGRLFSFAL